MFPSHDRGGWIDGEPHSKGGVVINAEGGEFVVKKDMALKHKSLIEAINKDELPKINAEFMNSVGVGNTANVVVSTKEWGEIRDLLKDNLDKGDVNMIGNRKIVRHGIRRRSIRI